MFAFKGRVGNLVGVEDALLYVGFDVGPCRADRDMADFALALDILHHSHEVLAPNLFAGGIVHLPDVDVVGLQTPQAGLDVVH